MQVTVKHNFIHQAPRKLRLISDAVRGLPTQSALAELAVMRQAASEVIRKTVTAGIAAASGKGMSEQGLYIVEITVDEGPKMRRFIPRSKGRSQPILKRMSHVKVTLTDEPITIASSKVYKRELQPLNKGRKVSKETAKTEETIAIPEPVASQTETTATDSARSK